MTETMFMAIMPPGEMEPLVCEDCACTQFHLFAESREGEITQFHTKCSACGKRGVLDVKVEMVTTRKFVEFADPPEGSIGFTVTVEGQPTVTSSTGPWGLPEE